MTPPLIVRGTPAIGGGLPSYVMAEIGTNHNRDLETAKAMLHALAQTGCDCAKFQIYEPDEIVSARVRAADYGFDGLYGDISAQEMFERHLKTPKAWFPDLRDVCHALGLDCSATIHGVHGLRWAQDVGLDIVKIASMDHTNLPFVRRLVNAVEAPILVSAGMADLDAIDAIVTALHAHRYGVGLFHCCTMYPAPAEDARLSNIAFLADRYALPIGFSDHTLGEAAAVDARRSGAVVFEKHVTLDHTQPGPDHSFAMEMGPFDAYVRRLKETPVADAGAVEPFLAPSAAEARNKTIALKSVIARRDLDAGHVLSEDDVYMARPGTGISPAELTRLLGRTLTRSVPTETPIQWSDVESHE